MESKDEEQPGERGEQRRHRRSLATALARRRRIGSWRQRSGGPRPPRGSRAFGAGGAFAVRARTIGEGPTTVGEERSYQALLTTPRICGRGTSVCRCFLTGAGRGRAGGVRSRALFAGRSAVAGVCEIGSSASALWGARVAAVELAPATAFWASVTAWVTMSSAATEPASDGCWAAPSAESTIP